MRARLVAGVALAGGLSLGLGPGDLAPGAPELTEAEQRLGVLLAASRATGAAVARWQAAWTERPVPDGGPCADVERLAIGWRIERFGAAWREAAQALRVQAERTRRIRDAPTAAPLVTAAWAGTLDGLFLAADAQSHAFLEASAWQAAFVRGTLAACPIVTLQPDPGVARAPATAGDDPEAPIAVLALGDGVVCPTRRRADDAVLLLHEADACWAGDDACACTPQAVFPGAVLGPPTAEPVPEEASTPGTSAATDAPPTPADASAPDAAAAPPPPARRRRPVDRPGPASPSP